jgi:hypothetical protein
LTIGSESPGAVVPSVARVTLRLQFNRAIAPAAVAVSINGRPAGGGTGHGRWVEYSVPPGTIHAGSNQVSVAVAAGESAAAWTDLHCTVHPAANPP